MAENRPKIGLALGSGGPRGMAHIGVIKVLKEAGIPIDYIAGSSVGAVVGGLYSVFQEVEAVEKVALSLSWMETISLMDISARQGVIKGDKIVKYLQELIGSVDISELKIPLSVMATDLSTGKAVFMDKGDLVEAIRASISIPLVLKPLESDGRILADGGLSSPVPVETVKKMGADIVIAVNIEGDLFDYRRQPKQTLTIARTSIDALRYHLAKKEAEEADVVITIHSRSGDRIVDELDLDAKELIAAGEKYAKAALPDIQKYL